MSYTDGTIKMSPSTWNASATTVQTGSTNTDDLSTAVNSALNSLFGALNTVGFLTSSKNLITALEDFGQGMAAALACIGADLTVVASGLAAAATAFSGLDTALSTTFAQLETQLGYYTNTALGANATLPVATAAANAALNALTASTSTGTSTSSVDGISTTTIHFTVQDGEVVAAIAGTVIVVAVASTIDWGAVLLALGLIALA